jgi:hypothetical protein
VTARRLEPADRDAAIAAVELGAWPVAIDAFWRRRRVEEIGAGR